jgi:hypothetical protein
MHRARSCSTIVVLVTLIANTRFPTGDTGSARQVQLAIKALF